MARGNLAYAERRANTPELASSLALELASGLASGHSPVARRPRTR
jgi:hypothetical protein